MDDIKRDDDDDNNDDVGDNGDDDDDNADDDDNDDDDDGNDIEETNGEEGLRVNATLFVNNRVHLIRSTVNLKIFV